MNHTIGCKVGLAIVVACFAQSAQAQFNDGHGKVWRQLTVTRGISGKEVSSVCPTDGVTPGAGTVRGVDFTGWVWATRAQVQNLFSYFEPRILQETTLQGPAYVLSAMGFTSTFTPTYSYYIVSTSYEFVGGWMADTLLDGRQSYASVSARWPAFNGTWTIDGGGDSAAGNNQSGVWLWQAARLAGDVNCDGVVSVSDIAPFVLALTDPVGYPAVYPECTILNADVNANGVVTVGDISAFVTLLTQ